jgi:hypothetical protein
VSKPDLKEEIPMTVQTQPRSLAVNLINEALARARTRMPQNAEARRSARQIAMQARQDQARVLGHLPLTIR